MYSAALQCPYLGMGDVQTGEQAVAVGGAIASGTIATLTAAGAIAGPVGAIVGAAIGVVATAVSALIRNSGCGVTCVETSSWANQAEPLLRQNVLAYFSLPAPRSASSRAAALSNFDAVWQKLQELCGQPGTGDAGVRCISDRQAGACTWKQTSTSQLLSVPGEPVPGACWNWFSGYRDPIANDSQVESDETVAGLIQAGALPDVTQQAPGFSFGLVVLLAGAGLIAWGLTS